MKSSEKRPVIFVIDTGYLLELFRVPGHSNSTSSEKIRKMFKKAIEDKARLYVHLACIFELANHIAHVNDGNRRNQLAEKLTGAVKRSIANRNPWIIVPATGLDELPDMFEKFRKEYVIQGIGLTDASVIYEARRLKEKYKDYAVYIWTTDTALKSQEPDPEKNSFTG